MSDQVAIGAKDWVDTLKKFYFGEAGLVGQLGEAERTADTRAICTVPIGSADGLDIVVRVSREGHPLPLRRRHHGEHPQRDRARRDHRPEWAYARLMEKAAGPRELVGKSANGEPIYILTGRFGPFIQQGEAKEGEKPRRAPRCSRAWSRTRCPSRRRSSSCRCRATSGPIPPTARRSWRRTVATAPTCSREGEPLHPGEHLGMTMIVRPRRCSSSLREGRGGIAPLKASGRIRSPAERCG